MIALSSFNYMSAEQYLEWEEKQENKHEYLKGEVFAMTGGTLAHNSICINLVVALRTHLRGKKCKVFMANAMLGVGENSSFHYPDVMVTCSEIDTSAQKIVYNPCLIAEVLSPSTEAYDRGAKWRQYRQIPALREYILISTKEKLVELFLLNDRGIWELYSYGDGEIFEINSVSFTLSLEVLYEDILLG